MVFEGFFINFKYLQFVLPNYIIYYIMYSCMYMVFCSRNKLIRIRILWCNKKSLSCLSTWLTRRRQVSNGGVVASMISIGLLESFTINKCTFSILLQDHLNHLYSNKCSNCTFTFLYTGLYIYYILIRTVPPGINFQLIGLHCSV